RPPVVLAGTRALERHEPPELWRAAPPQHVGFGASEAREVLERQVDAPAGRVFRDVAEDVRQLEGEPEVGRVVARGRVLIAEDLDRDQPNGRGDAIAVLREVALPPRVSGAAEIHLDAVDHRVEMR